MKKIFKNIISLLLIFGIISTVNIFSMTVSAWSYDKTVFYYGDTDKSGTINAKDALQMLQYSVGKIKNIEGVEKVFWDANGDSKINAKDALLSLQIAVGKVDGKTGIMMNKANSTYTPCEHLKVYGNYRSGYIASINGRPKGEISWTSNTINERKFITLYGEDVKRTDQKDNQQIFAVEEGKTNAFVYTATTNANLNKSEVSYIISITCASCDKKVANIFMHLHY